MTSRIALITVVTAALSAGGLTAKQDAASPHRQFNRLDRMSAALNLTDQQTQQAHSIFRSERAASRSVRQQLFQERKSVQSAIQSGKPIAEIQQLAKNEAPALGDLAAMRAGAFARFCAVLTPEQQQKLATLHQEWRQRHARAGNAATGNTAPPQTR